MGILVLEVVLPAGLFVFLSLVAVAALLVLIYMRRKRKGVARNDGYQPVQPAQSHQSGMEIPTHTHAYFDTLVVSRLFASSDSLDKDEDDKEVRLRVLLPNVQFPPHVSCRMLLYLRQQ